MRWYREGTASISAGKGEQKADLGGRRTICVVPAVLRRGGSLESLEDMKCKTAGRNGNGGYEEWRERKVLPFIYHCHMLMMAIFRIMEKRANKQKIHLVSELFSCICSRVEVHACLILAGNCAA